MGSSWRCQALKPIYYVDMWGYVKTVRQNKLLISLITSWDLDPIITLQPYSSTQWSSFLSQRSNNVIPIHLLAIKNVKFPRDFTHTTENKIERSG